MKKIVCVCDRCKKEIAGRTIRIEAYTADIKSDEPIDTEAILTVGGAPVDLCESCMVDVMAAALNEVAAASAPEKKAARKPPIDTGKLAALYKSGWTGADIARELGCSDQTVWNWVDKLGIKMTDEERAAAAEERRKKQETALEGLR